MWGTGTSSTQCEGASEASDWCPPPSPPPPWVTLHHFTLPRWFAPRGGFLVGAHLERWTCHVEFVAETFGDLVGGWMPVNEANCYGMLHYGGFGFPHRTGRTPLSGPSSRR